jgi:hypothetical protein
VREAFVPGRCAGRRALIERGISVYIGVGTVIFVILVILLILYLT